MKTLDEVIEILEKVVKHDYVWFDERTALMTIETLTDTLQYLQELRDMTDIPMEYFESGGTWQKLRNTSQITCPKCHSEFVILDDPDGDHAQLLKCQALLQDFYRNDPLTWDKLKTMEGRPVWIEDGLENGEWYIIECFTESGRFIAHDRYADDTVFKAIDMGNMWQAYRKECL